MSRLPSWSPKCLLVNFAILVMSLSLSRLRRPWLELQLTQIRIQFFSRYVECKDDGLYSDKQKQLREVAVNKFLVVLKHDPELQCDWQTHFGAGNG